jgi:hypothetical protein
MSSRRHPLLVTQRSTFALDQGGFLSSRTEALSISVSKLFWPCLSQGHSEATAFRVVDDLEIRFQATVSVPHIAKRPSRGFSR